MTERDPQAKTVGAFIEALTILANFIPDDQKYWCGGEHDIIHVYVSTDALPEESERGQRLLALGWHVEDDGWACFT